MGLTRELPMVESMVPCREIFENARTHEFILVGPFNTTLVRGFPCVIQFSMYLKLVNGRGRYAMAFEVHDESDEVIWDWNVSAPLDFASPLQAQHLAIYDLQVSLATPGTYVFVLKIEGQPVAHNSLSFGLSQAH
jgi:hypothetical protein